VAAVGAVAHPGPRDHPDALWSPSRRRMTRLPPHSARMGRREQVQSAVSEY
jgi:hypothetical protein